MQYKNALLLGLLSVISSVSFAQVVDNAVIYKYKDNKGNIIYSDNIPSSEKGQYSVLSGKSGILKQVVEKEMTSAEVDVVTEQKNKDKKTQEDSVEQKKRDNSLLATYSSVNDITKLKNFELSQINQSITNQVKNITDIKEKISQINLNLEKTPNNQKLKENIQSLQGQLTESNNILDSNKTLLESRTKKYQSDEVRYVDLLKLMGTKNADNSNPAH